MFSDKEYLLVFGGGMGAAFLYFISKLAVIIDIGASNIVGSWLILLQTVPFILYMILAVMHIQMLYYSKKFMDKSVEGEFKKTFKLLNYSEVITVLSLFWILLFIPDIPTFVNTWAENPSDALKLSFFNYWFFQGILFKWQYAILWHFPFTVFSAILEIVTYRKYFKAMHRYTNMFPSVPAPDFYNTFISKRRKNRTSLIIPTDNFEEIEVPPCDNIPNINRKKNTKEDPYSPLGKNLGNNSLYVVDPELLNKRRSNTYKTQTEIDAEEGGFFCREDINENMKSFLPKRKVNIDQKSQEYEKLQGQNSENYPPQTHKPVQPVQPIHPEQPVQLVQPVQPVTAVSDDKPYDSEIPLDFDYQSFYRTKETNSEKSKKEENKEKQNLIPCPFCGTLNVEGRDECIFCGAELNLDIKNMF